MGELGALFNPGMRHELEERQAKAARREEEGNAKDGDLRIDLESGVAVINAPGEDSTASAQDTAERSEAADTQAATAAEPDAAPDPAESRTAAGKAPARSPRPVKGARGTGSPEKPALQPRGKRGAPAAR